MKKVLTIIGFIALALVGGLFGLAYYMITRKEDELNKKRTEPARANRWPKPTESDAVELNGQPKPEPNEKEV